MPKTDISDNPPYDPQKTPDIIYGLLLLGLNIEKVSERLGVSLETLTTWIAIHPELAELNDRVICADAAVLTALHEAATGLKNNKGEWSSPPNIRAIDLWIKHRKIGLQPEGPDTSKPMTAADRKALAAEIYNQIKNEIPVTIKNR